jgi:hypothetical protein
MYVHNYDTLDDVIQRSDVFAGYSRAADSDSSAIVCRLPPLMRSQTTESTPVGRETRQEHSTAWTTSFWLFQVVFLNLDSTSLSTAFVFKPINNDTRLFIMFDMCDRLELGIFFIRSFCNCIDKGGKLMCFVLVQESFVNLTSVLRPASTEALLLRLPCQKRFWMKN